MKKNKTIGLFIILALVGLVAYGGVKLTQPSYSLTMDVNPSIEIISSRLDRVVEVKPLNDDAREMLKDFNIKDKDLTKTIEDLADLMVLTGYISGGEDNLVMITVNDGKASDEVLNKVNKAIAAYLENKQIEAIIVNQSIPKGVDYDNNGKYVIVERIGELDDDLDFASLAKMTLRELIEHAESKDIEPEKLFTKLIRTKGMGSANLTSKSNEQEVGQVAKTEAKTEESSSKPSLIGEAKAKEIALAKTGGGTIVEYELDWDDGTPEYEIEIKGNGYEYELEIHGYTGKILDFERDKDDDYKKSARKTSPKKETSNKQTLIGEAKAKEIALAKSGGGRIVEFELDWDDGVPEYEIEIKKDGYEYEIEIHGYTGKILDFEMEKDD